MNYLGNNLKWLRKSRELTQEELANKLGVKRSLIGAYEEGRVEPKLRTILNACLYFSVDLDALITTDLSREKPKDKKQDIKGDKLRVLPVITEKDSHRELCTLVPVKASAGYLRGYGDIDYIESLPRFSLPFPELSGNRSYRMFQVSGESMLPVPSGAYIIGEFVQNWYDIRNDECYVLITRDEGIVFKRLINNLKDGELTLKSDNPEYEPYSIQAEQLVEVWKARGYVSFELPSGQQTSLNVADLTGAIMELKDEMRELKTKLGRS